MKQNSVSRSAKRKIIVSVQKKNNSELTTNLKSNVVQTIMESLHFTNEEIDFHSTCKTTIIHQIIEQLRITIDNWIILRRLIIAILRIYDSNIKNLCSFVLIFITASN